MSQGEAIERTLRALRAQGGHVTDQRRAILSVLFEQSDHVTADSLTSRVRDSLPDVHIATVYRFMDTLEELQLVTHVHLGHGPAVYHLTDSRHAHVVCESCGAIGVIDESLVATWSQQLAQSLGFTLVDQHFALAGRCLVCATDQLALKAHHRTRP